MDGKFCLIDMDGTLFDHDAALRRDMLRLASTDEIKKYDLENLGDFHQLEHLPWMKERIDMIRKQPGWWRNLDRFQLGWDVYELAKATGFCCKILTKGPNKKPLAWTEKVQCIQDHFGEEMSIDIVGKDKGGTYGKVLVDDFPKYLLKWLKHRPRGLAIMPAHSYNADFEHENVIRYDGNNRTQVGKALRAALDRQEKQHWKELL